jgi:hypothetical protein
LNTCAKCKEAKPDTEFNVDRSRPLGLSSYCRPCGTENRRKWRAANPDKQKVSMRRGNLKRYYGMTPADYEAMFEAQGGCCAICRIPQAEIPKAFAVDHDHTTGQVRALLCHSCNFGLGYLHESEERLARAIGYLRYYAKAKPQHRCKRLGPWTK